MKKVTTLLIIAALVGCHNETEKTKEQLTKIGTQYFAAQLKPGEKMDAISLVKYDSLSSQLESEYLWYEYNKKLDEFKKRAEFMEQSYQVKEQLNKLQPTTQLQQEMKNIESEYESIIAKALHCDSVANNLLTASKALPTNDFKGYRAWFKVASTDAKGVQQTFDSLELTINPEFKVREFKNEVKGL